MIGGRGRRVWLAAALLTTLAGATGAAQPPPCQPEQVATLPIDLERNLALVPVTVNGTEIWMGVDTGAQNSLVTAAAARLGLPHDPTRRTRVISGAGATLVQNVRLNDVAVGDLVFYGMSVVAVPLQQPEGVEREADGLLGADVLSAYDVEFDFPGRRLNLYQVPDCARGLPPWPGRFAAVPARLTPLRLLLLPVAVDGLPMTALFDTGSDVVRLARSAALRIGVTDAMLAHDPGRSGLAPGGPTHVMSAHRFTRLQVGSDDVRNPVLEVGSLAEAGADMLLGLNYMRGRRFWLSYATHMIYIQAP